MQEASAGNASPAHLRITAHGRDGAVGLVDGPHELLGDEFTDIRAVGLDVAILRRKIARLAHAVIDVLKEVILESCCLEIN